MKQDKTVFAYSVKEFSKATNISESNIRRAIKAGELKCVQPIVAGNVLSRYLILPKHAAKWINSWPETA